MFQGSDGTRKLNFNHSPGNFDGILIGQESFQGGKGASAGLVGTGSGLDLNLKSCSLGPEKKQRRQEYSRVLYPGRKAVPLQITPCFTL